MPKLQVIVGGQYGSEGKGAIAAALARRFAPHDPLTAVRVGGSQAGHTVIGKCPPTCLVPFRTGTHRAHDADHHPWRLRHVPVAAVVAPDAQLFVAAGSEIDVEVLLTEVHQLDAAGYRVSDRLLVSPRATVIEDSHLQTEKAENLIAHIGSTGKGVGAARAARALRTARLSGTDEGLRQYTTEMTPQRLLLMGDNIQIEGTQGYALGTHYGPYPWVTSGDCTAIDMLSQAGVSPWTGKVQLAYPVELEVWVVLRCYPIRVAGNSGPMFHETDWESLGLPQEHTTVTNKVRRVGHWDPSLARDALFANGAPSPHVHVALTMVDQRVPAVAGRDSAAALDAMADEDAYELGRVIKQIESGLPAPVELIGTGPSTVVDWAAYKKGK